MAFTKAQENAMTARGRALLVSAAAGSGKTFTLTRRIIKAITEEGRSLSRMLIVTFTRSAAAELKKKISDAISEAIAEHTALLESGAQDRNEEADKVEIDHAEIIAHLQSELLKLGSAHISTIDAFFALPVKANFEKLGLPPSMRLADEAELAPLRESVFRETLDLFFDSRSGLSEGEIAPVGHSSLYTDLLGLLSGIRDSSDLIPSLLDFYKKTLTLPDGVASLKKSAMRQKESASLDFFSTLEGEIVRKEAKEATEEAILRLRAIYNEILETVATYCDGGDVPLFVTALKTKIAPAIDTDITTCIRFSQLLEGSYAECFGSGAVAFKNYPALKGDNQSDYSARIKDERSSALSPVKELFKKLICYSEEAISRCFSESGDFCLLLYELLSEFDRRYCTEKLSRGICEFSDMPKFVLKLLLNPDGSKTDLACAMADSYDEVYIDEYQDVNAIQDKIFEIIGGNRRFMVGDIKQSIYCFRDAEPSIFSGYRRRFPKYDPDHPEIVSPDGGSSIFMSENFRCDHGVIDFSNAVCSEIFSAFAESIGYDDENDKLKFGKIGATFIPPKTVKVSLITPPPPELDENGKPIKVKKEEDENEDKLYDESVILGNEIARLIRDKNETNADGSRVRAGDIAVLVRTHKQIDVVGDILSSLGIKYVTNAKNELLSGNDMKLLCDLLSVIDNPRDDIPLNRVLTASLPCYKGPLTLDEVLEIRSKKEGGSLYDAIIDYAERDGDLAEKCAEVASTLDELRRLSTRVSADKLLRALSRRDRLSKLCETEAFTYLYNCACKYTRSAWNGLYSFIVYFKSLMEKGDSNSDPVKAQEDEVTIITMHQSKGLEYKICFLFGLGKSFNMRDLSSPMLFCRELGISLKLPKRADESADVYSRTLAEREENILWRASKLLATGKLLEEEARIFYVALTRAKERLYLSATLSDHFDAIKEKYTVNESCRTSAIRGSKSYIAWVLNALLGRADKEDIWKLEVFVRDEMPPLATRISRAEVESSAYGITELDKSLAASLLSPHGQTDEERLLSLIPAKVAASKTSSTMLDDSIFIPYPSGILFSDKDGEQGQAASDSREQLRRRIQLMMAKGRSFDSLIEVNKKPTAAERGSAAHAILGFCDFERVKRDGLDREIDRLLEKKLITKRMAEIVNRSQLEGFFESELFALIEDASNIRREFHFGLFRSAADFTEREELRQKVNDLKIFVQGSIDLIIEAANGELILCDYKTDKITAEEKENPNLLVQNMRGRHADQLEEYRFAVKEIFGKEPSRIYIYSIPLGRVIEI